LSLFAFAAPLNSPQKTKELQMAFTTTGAKAGYTAGVELKPSVLDAIVKQGNTDTPILKAIGRGTTGNFIHSWITDRYAPPKANAKTEISTPTATTQSTKQKTSNYVQIFSNDLLVSYSKQDASQYGEKELNYQISKTAKEHATDIEFALLGLHNATIFTAGVARTESAAGKMGGIFYFIPTANKIEAADLDEAVATRVPLTWDLFSEILQKAWEAGGEVNKVFVGAGLKGTINKFAKDYLIHDTGEHTFDPRITKVATDFGIVDVVIHRMFTEANKLATIVFAGDFKKARLMRYGKERNEEVPTDKTGTIYRFYNEATLEVADNDCFACGYGYK
jgi:hypothetical protein